MPLKNTTYCEDKCGKLLLTAKPTPTQENDSSAWAQKYPQILNNDYTKKLMDPQISSSVKIQEH